MSTFTVRARPAEGDRETAPAVRDADILASRLEDAAHFPGGHATELRMPTSEAQLAGILRSSRACLPIGAQSSLTGGATPMGETLISTAHLNAIQPIAPDRVRVGAGLTLVDLERALAESRRSYPPVPTFLGATIGGVVSTNAAGASTFKYGTTRDWVIAITVVLASGDVLDIERGATRAHADGYFDLELAGRNVRVSIPGYQMPRVAKLSAGYFAAPGMDLIDLFIGSEGTLGIITAATLRVLPVRPMTCLALAFFDDRSLALSFVDQLRRVSQTTWNHHDRAGIDASAIEHIDERCLALVREDSLDRASGVRIPAAARIALLVTLDMPEPAAAQDSILSRFAGMLAHAGALDHVEIAAPGDNSRAAQLLALREAVPAAVNARVGRAKERLDQRIEKTAADMIVPFEKFGALLDAYESEFARRGLDAAIWGHVSDGNVHPNVIPRSLADVEAGKEAILACGREALRLGGAPLAEHGVGRNPVKQQLLRMMYGEEGIAQMRAVKHALDPEWRLSPGVLFPKLSR